jgi:hypothetical protein
MLKKSQNQLKKYSLHFQTKKGAGNFLCIVNVFLILTVLNGVIRYGEEYDGSFENRKYVTSIYYIRA